MKQKYPLELPTEKQQIAIRTLKGFYMNNPGPDSYRETRG